MNTLKKKDRKMENNNSITTFEQHLDKRYGEPGTDERMAFEAKAKAFAIGELIKGERRLAKMTQEELAKKTGTKKSFISRIENGKSDIQLSTLYRILEIGLGKRISLIIE
jgi:ribosome-binding protein aMBF1 (putative translation factor)